jgi:hypothetical protein
MKTGTANRQQISMEWNEAGKKAGLPSSVFCKATYQLNSESVSGHCQTS